MWTILFLYILALNFCQANGGGNSTQMLYAKLIIDKNAIENVTNILNPFVNSTDFYVESPAMTTKCDNATNKVCNCSSGYIWSDTLCQSNPTCCSSKTCTLMKSVDAMCILNTTVTITGSLKLPSTYENCLKSAQSSEYQACRSDLLTKMKIVFSTLRGFDYLNITGFRLGSIITDFVVSVASSINSQVLINISLSMAQNLAASLDMNTSGVVRLIMPKMPVLYETNQTITCIANEDLKASPEWSITNRNGKYDITNGTVSNVTILSATESKISLKKVTDLWAGDYLCLYHQISPCNSGCFVNIFHKGSATLDVALQPDIAGFTEPSFPRCVTDKDILEVTAKCEIMNSTEPYTVLWSGNGLKDNTSQPESDNLVAYTVKKIIKCGPTASNEPVCTFKNRLGQTKNFSVPFIIIQANDLYCKGGGDWEDTKAGFTAVLKCKGAAGLRQRTCDSNGNWREEQSGCVNSNLYSVLQNAIISDTGLGLLDQNVANVFSTLQNATKTPDTINTFANVNTSVVIISTMSDKLQNISSQTTIEDLLTSSSNLLDESLGNSWKPQNTNDNKTLAEKYLLSVENLIKISNMTNSSQKENIQVKTCSGTGGCTSNVFAANVTVTSSGNGIVKTAGFQNLQNYLPNTTDISVINSMIVSATTTENQTNPLKITINFQLIAQRPQDVELDCVSWDFNKSQWLSDGCIWGGASNPNVCICSHLTSFAILMSRTPLTIPYIDEITYTGLSVSVVSLVISLLIEMIVWNSVVKTNTLYLRHTAHINISLCLLVADSCFLASSVPEKISIIWCRISALLKHFCYLAMFFWMLSLSTTLLHQAVFLFHKVSKKTYLRFSLILGYVCPFLIVFITFLTNNAGDSYFDKNTCWLIHAGILKGSIYTFILPIGIIVFINLFSMVVVIMKLLDHKSTDKSRDKEMRAAKTVLRTVVLLTPVFGLPWIFGFATFSLDLTDGVVTLVVNYAFVLFNAFQGLFILLTTCLGDKMTREALLNSCRKKKAPPMISESSKSETTKKSEDM